MSYVVTTYEVFAPPELFSQCRTDTAWFYQRAYLTSSVFTVENVQVQK